jgi:hypothetical protein
VLEKTKERSTTKNGTCLKYRFCLEFPSYFFFAFLAVFLVAFFLAGIFIPPLVN